MPRTFPIAGRLFSNLEMENYINAGIDAYNQTNETRHDGQSDPQAHIYNIELSQLRADLLATENECTDAKEEKDILMQEAQHRIKNSLQLLQSIIYLQASKTVDEVASGQLYNSAARIRAIGAMYDRIHRSEAMAEVGVKPYLEALIADLCIGVVDIADRQIVLHADNAIWAEADISSLGLVLTELVTNALKYGAGNISVYFYQQPDRQAVLIVEDEGTLAPGFNLNLSAGFGVKLIEKLIARRGGSLMVDGMANHTRFIAVMPRPRNAIGSVRVGDPPDIVHKAEDAAA